MPVTIKDIAAKAGVSRMTVSRALRNHPDINVVTAREIRRLAEAMGYASNPLVSAWMSSVAVGKPATFTPRIAWLSGYFDAQSRQSMLFQSGLFEAAKRRAGQLGFVLEDHCLTYGGMEPRRVSRILETRACPGVILTPLPVPVESIDFDWRPFSVVAIGYSLRSPGFHRVSVNHGMGITSALENLALLGRKKIGLVLKLVSDDRTNHSWTNAYLGFCWRRTELAQLPIHMPVALERRSFVEWFRAHRPDAIIGADPELIDWYEKEDRRSGERRCVFVHLHEEFAGDPRIFGVVTGEPEQLSSAAVNILASQIKFNERGVPANSLETMIPCRFRLRRDGK